MWFLSVYTEHIIFHAPSLIALAGKRDKLLRFRFTGASEKVKQSP
jgi:hypothetical protein